MKARVLLAAVLLAGCAKAASDGKDTTAAAVQAGVDSMSAEAERGSHDSLAAPRGTRPIIERNQRDSTGKALPRTGATQSATTRVPTKQDSVIPPGPPQLKVDTLIRKP